VLPPWSQLSCHCQQTTVGGLNAKLQACLSSRALSSHRSPSDRLNREIAEPLGAKLIKSYVFKTLKVANRQQAIQAGLKSSCE